MRKLSAKGRRHIGLWEGRKGKPVLKAYLDGGRVPTIGFGHTKGVRLGMTCTVEQAEQWLDEDADEAETAVNKLVKVRINQNQFDALVSFAFNVGVDAFRTSTLLRVLNQGRYDLVPAQMMRWVKDVDPDTGKMVTVPGLVNRRTADSALWLEPIEGALAMPDELPAQTGRRPVAPPAPKGVLGTSTGKAQATALVAGGTAAVAEVAGKSFGETLQEVLGQLEPLTWAIDSLKFVLVGGTLLLIGWTLYDRHRKLKENGQ